MLSNVFGFLCPNYEILLILSFIVKEINQKYLRIYILGLLRLTLKILIGKPSFFEKDLLILEAVSLWNVLINLFSVLSQSSRPGLYIPILLNPNPFTASSILPCIQNIISSACHKSHEIRIPDPLWCDQKYSILGL